MQEIPTSCGPQSSQSVPNSHISKVEPGPPSSQAWSAGKMQSLEQRKVLCRRSSAVATPPTSSTACAIARGRRQRGAPPRRAPPPTPPSLRPSSSLLLASPRLRLPPLPLPSLSPRLTAAALSLVSLYILRTGLGASSHSLSSSGRLAAILLPPLSLSLPPLIESPDHLHLVSSSSIFGMGGRTRHAHSP